jgi:predicted HicB family RNase H-like nuclease
VNILEYKGYHGSVETDLEHDVLRGKILFIADLVTYLAENPAQLKKEFEAAVEDYLDTCRELGRAPQKPASGTFNIRTSPHLHRAAQVRAILDGVSMNEVVTRALDCYLNQSREIREKHVETRVETRYVSLEGGGTETYFVPYGETKSTKVRHVN